MNTETKMKSVGDFELIDHGVEGSQYFQGCGTWHTGYENVVTGIGMSPAEAVEDCLDQMASNGYETEGMEKRICEDLGLKEIPTEDVVHVQHDTAEIWLHISIRWNEEEEKDFPELLDDWMNARIIYHMEMESGVANLEELLVAIGYNNVHHFLCDNSGAMEAIVEWIGEQGDGCPEWKQGIKDSLEGK